MSSAVAVSAGQPTGDEGLPDAVRRERQVGDGAHAAEALPEHAPRLAGQLAPDQLGVEHDAVGAEVGQVVGLGLRRSEPGQGLPVRRGGPAGAALVEQQDPVVLQRPVQPGLPAPRAAARRTRGRPAGTAARAGPRRPCRRRRPRGRTPRSARRPAADGRAGRRRTGRSARCPGGGSWSRSDGTVPGLLSRVVAWEAVSGRSAWPSGGRGWRSGTTSRPGLAR